MEKLSTKFTYHVYADTNSHLHVIVTRLTDGATKYFYQAHGSVKGMTYFLDSMTDELMDGYFPKKGKPTDNWAYLGDNPGRIIAESEAAELSGTCLTHYRLCNKI